MEFCGSQYQLDWGALLIVTCSRQSNHIDDHEGYPFGGDAEWVVYWDDTEALK